MGLVLLVLLLFFPLDFCHVAVDKKGLLVLYETWPGTKRLQRYVAQFVLALSLLVTIQLNLTHAYVTTSKRACVTHVYITS
jgi:hypothetical protein